MSRETLKRYQNLSAPDMMKGISTTTTKVNNIREMGQLYKTGEFTQKRKCVERRNESQ